MSPPIRLSSLAARRPASSELARPAVSPRAPAARPTVPSNDVSSFERASSVSSMGQDSGARALGPEHGARPMLRLFRHILDQFLKMMRRGDPSAPDESPSSAEPSVHADPGNTATL